MSFKLHLGKKRTKSQRKKSHWEDVGSWFSNFGWLSRHFGWFKAWLMVDICILASIVYFNFSISGKSVLQLQTLNGSFVKLKTLPSPEPKFCGAYSKWFYQGSYRWARQRKEAVPFHLFPTQVSNVFYVLYLFQMFQHFPIIIIIIINHQSSLS